MQVGFDFGNLMLHVLRASLQSVRGVFGHFPGSYAVLLAGIVRRPGCREHAGETPVRFVANRCSLRPCYSYCKCVTLCEQFKIPGEDAWYSPIVV